jgi:hypothetical protein
LPHSPSAGKLFSGHTSTSITEHVHTLALSHITLPCSHGHVTFHVAIAIAASITAATVIIAITITATTATTIVIILGPIFHFPITLHH